MKLKNMNQHTLHTNIFLFDKAGNKAGDPAGRGRNSEHHTSCQKPA